jgi:hypothetical protein
MAQMGRKGGKLGGKRSLETMTAEERSARAKKASLAAAKKRTAKRLARERTCSQAQVKPMGPIAGGPNEAGGRVRLLQGIGRQCEVASSACGRMKKF